jgi:hypothetical protein
MDDRIPFATRRRATLVPADRMRVLAERMGNPRSARSARERIEAGFEVLIRLPRAEVKMRSSSWACFSFRRVQSCCASSVLIY